MQDKILDGVESYEELGRGVFSCKTARKSRRSVPHNVFLESRGNTTISVDRLSVMPCTEALDNARSVAAQRKRKFYGWAVVTAALAASSERRVVATPQENNQFHADIVLPDSAQEDRDNQVQHARDLADASQWRPDPSR